MYEDPMIGYISFVALGAVTLMILAMLYFVYISTGSSHHGPEGSALPEEAAEAEAELEEADADEETDAAAA